TCCTRTPSTSTASCWTRARSRWWSCSWTRTARTRDDPLDTDLARLHALTGACALARGDVELARREAGLARRSFATRPWAADYRQAPLRRLEADLSARRG
ncbi:MAG TPA: hypothetical protein VGF12_17350, partial [Roseateles sp.]|uniref:hypothetical protein n=1 Tax=Roseateles sp. TaxID=1971397 RepID=UPI002ED7DC0F